MERISPEAPVPVLRLLLKGPTRPITRLEHRCAKRAGRCYGSIHSPDSLQQASSGESRSAKRKLRDITLVMSAYAKPSDWMTVAEFLDWSAQDGRRWQLVDGEPRAIAPARMIHARLQSVLTGLIDAYLTARGGPCEIFANPGIVPATMSAHNMRVPDLAVSCSPYDLTQTAMTEPVVIVEILSPSNRADTWANVWAYTSIASVQEILVLHSEKVGGDLLRRLADGTWPDRAMPVEGELALDSIGFRVSLSELYARTPLLPS